MTIGVIDGSNILTEARALLSSDHASVVAINLFVVLLCACIVIGHLLEENRWMNESITALFIGVCTGVVILLVSKGKSSRLLVFSEELFFIYLLPPIIFNAGFQVKKKQFFRNFLTITLFGAIGTLISTGVITAAIGAIFSATDSVCTLQVLNQDETPLLYSLVFGEGVVNDATSVVLFNAIQSIDFSNISSIASLEFVGSFLYLLLSSTVLGVAVGLLSAYTIKTLCFGRHSTDREVSIMILMAYLSYMLAELFSLSAILTVFFCGIVMSHYTWHNVTQSSRVTTKHAFATLSFVAEIFLFLYVGMDALDIEKWKFVSDSPGTSIAASSILMGLVLVGRAAFVFPLSFLSNLTKKLPSDKLTLNQQVTIWWAGLMRGAVSMALAYNHFTSSGHTKLRPNAIMITSTITIVLFSTAVFGLMTKPLIKILLPQPTKKETSSSEPSSPKSTITVPLLINDLENSTEEEMLHDDDDEEETSSSANILHRPTSLRMFLRTPSYTIHYYWRWFDDGFMRPVFGGRGFVPFAPGSPIESDHPPFDGRINNNDHHI
ncbi:Sodium/hydrogen exchanger 2 [Linum grandiflorum]